MAPVQVAIHDNLTEAMLRVKKAKELLRLQAPYTCQSVDLDALEVASRMLAHVRGLLSDVDRSNLQQTA